MATQDNMVTMVVMGEAFKVPEGSTIVTALEYAGFQLTTGVGCREGYCGACGTLFRESGDHRIKGGLACQTVVSDGMHLAQIPFVPGEKPVYDIRQLRPVIDSFRQLYPEIFRCLACNTCTKICPQELQVMDYVQSIIRGDLASAADLSFDCLRCGLCALRCPAEIVQYNAATLARRLYGRYLAPAAPGLDARVAAVSSGLFDAEIDQLQGISGEQLSLTYYRREIRTR